MAKFHDKDEEFFEKRPETVLAICQSLSPLMNEVHSTNFSKTFWTRLLIPYVWAFYNQQEHYRSGNYRYPVPFQPINGWSPPRKSQIIKDRLFTTLKSLKGRYSLRNVGDVLPPNGKITLGTRGEMAATELDATFLSFNWVPYIGFARHAPRKRLMSLAEKSNSQVSGWLLEQMPQVYLEYLGALVRLLQKINFVGISNVYVEHYGSFFDRLLAYYLSEHGALINQLQLGGYIGETTQSVDAIMRYKWDRHLTYGWQINPEDTPFYAIRLEQFRHRYNSMRSITKTIDLLVVYNQVNSEATREYYDCCSKDLRKNINAGRYPNIMLRPRGTTRLLSARRSLGFLTGFQPNQIGSGKEDMAELCAKTRLVINWSHPSTNFLECVFVDQPVVAVQLNDNPTDIVIPHYDFLHEVGVLHTDPSSLIRHVNNVDIESWWASVRRREEYRLFKRTFARSRAEYLSEVVYE